MDKKETLDKIKESLKNLMSFSAEMTKEKKFSNYDLTDGTTISSTEDELEVGVSVFKIDENGNQTPLDNGDYVLTDGRTIKVEDNEIKAIMVSKPEMDDNEEEMGKNKPENKLEQKMEEDGKPVQKSDDETDMETSKQLMARVIDLEKQVEDILAVVSKMGKVQNDVSEKMMSKIKELSDENGGAPIKSNGREETAIDYKLSKSGFADELKDFLRKREKINK